MNKHCRICNYVVDPNVGTPYVHRGEIEQTVSTDFYNTPSCTSDCVRIALANHDPPFQTEGEGLEAAISLIVSRGKR